MGSATTVILDGGMGRELQRRGAPFRQPEWSALALSEAPQAVEAVHAAYIASGANVITSNSYAVVPFHIGEARFAAEGQALAALAGELARRAVQASGKAVRVAGSLPPLFGSYRPDLFDASRASELLTPLVAGLAPHVDLWLAETQSSTIEAKAIHAGVPKDGKPFWLSAIDAARQTFERLGVKIHIGAYANAFPPQPKEATANDGLDPLREDLDPPGYLQWAADWQKRGASHLGGCCGIGPEHIAVLAQKLV